MSHGVDLARLVEAVHDRASFLEFVAALARDRRDEVETEARGWQNGSIESFLEAAASWARDVHRLPDERADWFPEAPSWQAFARLLYLGKIYE